MSSPDITVAICTHDNAEVLDRALRRLARQRVAGGSWELLVVDNRCSDRTPALLEAWQRSGAFPAMRVVREERLGLSNARRCAIAHARADVIAFIDDDCFLNRGWIAQAIAFARRHPRAGAFGGQVRIRWESPPGPLGAECEWALARQLLGNRPVRLPARAGVPLVGAGIVLRREALLQSGWIERAQFMGRTGKVLTAGDDAEMTFRIRAAGWELWYTPTMKIDHVLAAWRSEASYLARLFHGIGLTLPYMWILSGYRERTAFYGARHVVAGLWRFLRRAVSALNYRLRGDQLRSQRRWLDAQLELGTVRGALALPPPEADHLPLPGLAASSTEGRLPAARGLARAGPGGLVSTPMAREP